MSPSFKLIFLITTLLTLCSLSLFSNSLSQLREPSKSACVFDPIHESALPLTQFFRQTPSAKRLLIILDSFLIDFSMMAIGFVFLSSGSGAFTISSFVAFYLFRGVAISMSVFPVPRSFIFDDPGFPSFAVDYGRTNDLYFSGHTGFFCVLLIEALIIQSKVRTAFVAASLALTAFVLLVFQVHYLNDIIIGSVVATTLSLLAYKHRYTLLLIFQSLLCSICEYFESKFPKEVGGETSEPNLSSKKPPGIGTGCKLVSSC